jgi:Mn2+/Fe2+ NRAMP family transporter
MKVIVIILAISTIVAVILASTKSTTSFSLSQIFPKNSVEIAFLIAFMGWMPAPLDCSVWQSLWAIEKNKDNTDYNVKSSIFDFNVGYLATIVLGIGFVALGALIMSHSGETFSPRGSVFANQLISMYTKSLGNWASVVIGIAAFTTMFSTTITTLDASPRAMEKTSQLLFGNILKRGYLLWIIILTIGTIIIFFFLIHEMGHLVKIATILSFLTAPFYAIINYKLISSTHTPKEWRPSKIMHILCWLGILFLIGFSVWYLTTL